MSGREVGGQSVFFGGMAADTDAVVAPALNGAEFFAVLRSRLSPEQLRYRLTLPAGAVLRSAAGGAVVARGGTVLAQIPAPSARDVQGVIVPVQMTVSGDELLLHIERQPSDIAYPLLVDPKVITITNGDAGWKLTQTGAKNFTGTRGAGLSITGPVTTYPVGEVVVSTAKWEYLPPKSPELTEVEFQGLSLTASSKYVGGGEAENVGWQVSACGVTNGHQLTVPPSSDISFYGGRKDVHKCESATIGFQLSEEGITPSVDSGYFSVAAIVLTVQWNSGEGNESEGYGPSSEGRPDKKNCLKADPVNCATGNLTESQTDLSVGGRGPELGMTRTYNSQLAAHETEHGIFGYGWTGSYSAHTTFAKSCETCLETATVYENNGSSTLFENYEGQWYSLAPLVQATLVKEGTQYIYTLPNQTKLAFESTGRLASETDRNGNALTMKRNTEGRLESLSDSAGRKLTLAYNASGEVESATDPMGHVVKYTYESGNLVGVTQPGETSKRWKFKYNASHELTEMTDGRSNTVTTEYNGSHQVTAQTDALKRKFSWKYGTITEGTYTEVTEPNGAVTREEFDELGQPISITQAYGTALAATTTYEYNGFYNLIAVTNPDKQTTKYSYDPEGNLASETNPDGDETQWTYNSEHALETTTTPDGETTTIKREAHGNPESISREAPGSETQATKYKYDADGDLESMTNPLGHTWTYEYDSYGDRKSETDPEGNKRTWEYNEDSQETATVSPRGNVKEAEASKYTTKTERDAQGRPLTVTDPLGHKTKYKYDGDGNLETETDPNSNVTKHTYDADNEPTKVEEPNKTITETEYDKAGQVVSQTDGKKNVTKYVRNLLEEITEVVDPLSRKTTKEYDTAGNLTKVIDAAGRTTTYTYDPAGRLKELSYSDGKTHAVEYEYNKDGDVTVMKDGSGTTKYSYDQLDRTTETENGHGEVIKHEYNLGNELTKITYPNGKAVTRTYDNDGRLEKVTDWLEHTTKFSYDPDSDLATTAFPTGTEDEDKYAYNEADQLSEIKMMKGTETLASLVYTRDNDGQVKGITSKGLPGEEKPAYEYDANSRLKKGGTTSYEYDADNNPTKLGTSAYTYNKADELETGPSLKYTYNEVGERTKTTPTTGPATTYGYDQAGNLITVERPKEGEVAKIEDAYGYNGNGLRVSQTISGTTSYLAWDTAEEEPLLLSDGTNSYIYGPAGSLPIEQINNSTGTVLYLHDDQQGSTRLLTGSTGKVEGKCSYSPYGTPTCEGTATTPLGFDGQYTNSDTGLIYLRAREYDPSTAQFLSVDPIVAVTQAPYNYAGDNPVNLADPTGLEAIPVPGPAVAGCAAAPEICAVVAIGAVDAYFGIKVFSSVAGSEGGDEGEAELKEHEQQEVDCTANQIANGHAFEKHAAEFGVETPEELEEVVKDTLENATQSRELTDGRTAYYDEETNTLVIVNSSSPDGGTVFKPETGKTYFEKLK